MSNKPKDKAKRRRVRMRCPACGCSKFKRRGLAYVCPKCGVSKRANH